MTNIGEMNVILKMLTVVFFRWKSSLRGCAKRFWGLGFFFTVLFT